MMFRFAYFVTEYADEVLAQILAERALTPPEAREMLDPVIDALSYLHGKGFVHGDIKPTNIMVVSDQLKLSGDRIHGVGEQEQSVEGLKIYDAPEFATGKITTAADVWSLGVTLVESLTQHLPVWERSSNVDPILAESIPQPFSTIARECLRRDPGASMHPERYQESSRTRKLCARPAHRPCPQGSCSA